MKSRIGPPLRQNYCTQNLRGKERKKERKKEGMGLKKTGKGGWKRERMTYTQ